MKDKPKILLVIAGPTAVGKTALSIHLAKTWKTEIFSADSRQFFREMNKGTAKPSEEELLAVKHHLINTLSISEPYDAGKFETDVLQALDKFYKRNDIAILCGGSGLYIKALVDGFDAMPKVDPQVRAQLNELFVSEGIEALQNELKSVDPFYSNQIDLKNPQRIIRALEVYRSIGQTFSSFRKEASAVVRPFRTIKIGLELPRAELYERIDRRMDDMIAEGLFEEAEALFDYRKTNALQTVGYQEVFGFLEGQYDRKEAIRLLKRNSRRYAKRQMTWFKKDKDLAWFHPHDITAILAFIRRGWEEA